MIVINEFLFINIFPADATVPAKHSRIVPRY